MVFSSILFLFRFLPLALALYFLSPRGARNAVLFLASLVFYAWGEPVYIILMIFSTLVDYIHGRLVWYYKSRDEMKKAKCVVASSMMVNLGLLAVFKYTGLFPLPIGISFYTFQTMSYTIDVYRGDAKVQKNIISFGAYVAMFPQLIAGPIVQYKQIAEELDERRESSSDFAEGIRLFLTGLGKKVLYANSIGLLWENISSRPTDEISFAMAWLGIIAYAFQIYFDFSGYSDMAKGLGRMFGFYFPDNFNYPYCSKSITEFWRRWHISLGTWFREYVYIPLGGNRKGLAIQIRNILIVWLLTGIWHGAGINFLCWGAYYGCLLIVEKCFLLKRLEKLPGIIGHVYTMFAVLVGWVLFAFEEWEKGFSYLKAMLCMNGAGIFGQEAGYLLLQNGVLLLLAALASAGMFRGFQKKVQNSCIWYALLFLLCVAYLVDSSYNPFLYFRF
ncbi:MAG: MBOAT family protein [Lachnospiraceae bacterium]|nr:MBOAT family protein [Lachnospiraceae bacterium]